ncbi:degenerin-like protein unc-105 [Parasteatoda tepidariorum]|uniref:degenerin-like protein unc-105 n=1 Tax=Parasteatoda tepidariorum TaxID=114398 RepID=UPI0039BD1A4E
MGALKVSQPNSKLFDKYWKLFGAVEIKISFKKLHFTSITYTPKMMLSDFYSNVGGYLGIWIGVSLISIMDLLRRIISLLVLYVKKKKKRKKIFFRMPRRKSNFLKM